MRKLEKQKLTVAFCFFLATGRVPDFTSQGMSKAKCNDRINRGDLDWWGKKKYNSYNNKCNNAINQY